MSEAKFWTELNAGYRGQWDAERVDNRIAAGFPDVSYGMNGVNGHIELKYLASWPRDGIIDFARHFGDQFANQRRWLIRRGSAGGHCFLFVWIEQPAEWLLFRHLDLELFDQCRYGTLKVSEFQRLASGYWRDHIHWPRLTELLTGRPDCLHRRQ